MTLNEKVNWIIRVIEQSRIGLGTELDAQRDIAKALVSAGLQVKSEVSLSAADRIDLMCGRVGIEVKISGQKRRVFDQLTRYAQHDEVDALILATSTGWQNSLKLINGKPVLIASLARGWL